MDHHGLKGFTVVVTGAATGMGRAEATELAARGAHVWIADVAEDPGRELARTLTERGGRAEFFRLDVTDPSAWADLRDALTEGPGVVHGLVNNAGVSHRHGIVDTADEDWQRVLDINLSGIFYGMKYLAPLLKAAGAASVVNVSSIAGMTGYFAAGYAASKWGVRGISKTGALEFARWGVRVNSLHPGLVDTPLLWSGAPEFVHESLRSVPAGRVGTPEEITDAVLFLLSDASRYVTGTELVVDGGMTSSGLYHRLLSGLGDQEG
ncbi:SDR family NAD(P)-dependent oxidoreductase [Nocardiopsis alba]|uniref:SDR family NAD(P)-dependent oxidoreductase n=1 Tax=Nocardiopsis alba TaxID=53437 RepID=UPI0038216B38